jgi:hypothetical protein
MKVKIINVILFSAVFCVGGCMLFNKDLEVKDPYGIIKRSYFTPLNPGEILPEGWVKKQVELSVNGLGVDEKLLERNVWRKPTTPKRRGAFAWWPYEQQGYYMDGVTRLSFVAADQKLQDEVRKTYNAVVERQGDDGYSFCNSDFWHQGWLDEDKGSDKYRWMKTGFEGMHWSFAVFLRGVLAEYEATRDPRLLEYMRKHFRHYYHKGRDAKKLGKTINGHELYLNRGLVTVESMVEFLRLTEDPEVYRRAVEIFKNNEDGMVRNYLEGKFTTISHGVTYDELTKLYAIGYLLTGKKDYLKASEGAYEFLQENHMLPNGIHSSNEFLRGIGGFRNSETCDVSDFMWSNIWLLRASGNSKYADRIEKDFYNAAQRSVSWNYKKHVYNQSPNYLPGVNCDRHNLYKVCHNPLCCRMNLLRILPNFIINSTMRTHHGLAVMYYIPAIVKTEVNGESAEFEVTTDYPFSDSITLKFLNSEGNTFPLNLRIPEWCKNASISLNGKEQSLKLHNGFSEITSNWKKGDVLKLTLPMSIEVKEGRRQVIINDKGKDDPFCGGHGPDVNWPEFHKFAKFGYVTRGPLLFSLPVKKREEGAVALVAAATAKRAELIVKDLPLKPDWTWDRAPIGIKVILQDINVKYPKSEMGKHAVRNAHLPDRVFNVDLKREREAVLVPYGSTLYRMSLFPVAE